MCLSQGEPWSRDLLQTQNLSTDLSIFFPLSPSRLPVFNVPTEMQIRPAQGMSIKDIEAEWGKLSTFLN